MDITERYKEGSVAMKGLIETQQEQRVYFEQTIDTPEKLNAWVNGENDVKMD